MSKLSYEDKIKIYEESKSGKSKNHLSKKHSIGKDKIYYLVSIIDKHGFDIFITNIRWISSRSNISKSPNLE